MTKILVAAAAPLIVAGLAAWAGSVPNERVAPPSSVQIDPSQAIKYAKELPTLHFDDYSLVSLEGN